MRRAWRATFAAALCQLITFSPAQAADCRQALLLGLDVSLSVDAHDFTLQRQGLSSALLSPAVQEAMLRGPDHIEFAVFEWSGSFDQKILIDWTVIDSPATLQDIALSLFNTQQGPRSGRTGLGAALTYARDMLLTRTHCQTLTFDISGDGVNNSGHTPETVRDGLEAAGIGVNALVVEATPGEQFEDQPSIGQLADYFHQNVITGPQAFVEAIVGFSGYQAAIERKLLRELQPSLVHLTPKTRVARLTR